MGTSVSPEPSPSGPSAPRSAVAAPASPPDLLWASPGAAVAGAAAAGAAPVSAWISAAKIEASLPGFAAPGGCAWAMVPVVAVGMVCIGPPVLAEALQQTPRHTLTRR